MMERIPLSEVYGEGITLDIDSQFYEHTTNWQPLEDIPWDYGIKVSPAQQEALATVATQFHFGKLIDLMLCGRIMEREPDMDVKRLAILLSTARMRSVDAWGRYMHLLKETGEIIPQLDSYMCSMYDDSTDPLSLLIGMAIVGDISGSIILEELKQLDEPVLNQLTQNMVEQTKKNRESAVNYLRPTLARLHPNRLIKIRNEVREYRRSFQEIIHEQDQAFRTLGLDPDHSASIISDEIDIFLKIIMSDTG